LQQRLRIIGPFGGLGLAAILGVGYVHFYLRVFGDPEYANAPKINYLFIANAVFAVVFVAAFLNWPHWTSALMGAGFALATMASYFYSHYHSSGLFKFKEIKVDGWGQASITCEIIAAIALLAAVAAAVVATAADVELLPQAVTTDPAKTRAEIPSTICVLRRPTTTPILFQTVYRCR
jgi:hypothetical protein